MRGEALSALISRPILQEPGDQEIGLFYVVQKRRMRVRALSSAASAFCAVLSNFSQRRQIEGFDRYAKFLIG